MSAQVHFDQTTRIYSVPAVWEMSTGEINAMWPTKQELKIMRQDLVKTLNAMKKQKPSSEEDGLCFRGLEHMQSPAHRSQRETKKKCVNKAILDEQERQRSEGINNPVEIARVVIQNSRQDVVLALQIGLSDATIVRKMNQTCNVMDPHNSSLLIGLMTKKLPAHLTLPSPERHSSSMKKRRMEHLSSILEEALLLSRSSENYSVTHTHKYTGLKILQARLEDKRKSF